MWQSQDSNPAAAEARARHWWPGLEQEGSEQGERGAQWGKEKEGHRLVSVTATELSSGVWCGCTSSIHLQAVTPGGGLGQPTPPQGVPQDFRRHKYDKKWVSHTAVLGQTTQPSPTQTQSTGCPEIERKGTSSRLPGHTQMPGSLCQGRGCRHSMSRLSRKKLIFGFWF